MMSVNRYTPDDLALSGREVVLASDYDILKRELDAARAVAGAMNSEASLGERMKAAGMLTIPEILEGGPLDRFIKHAHVVDLQSFVEWVHSKRVEYLTMHARMTVEHRENDELFEWVSSHTAVFGEVMINLKAALEGTKPEPHASPDAAAREVLHACMVAAGVVSEGHTSTYTDVVALGKELKHQIESLNQGRDSVGAVIAYILANPCESPIEFLRCWNEGNFDALRTEWENVPEEVFIGADTHNPSTVI